MESASSSQHSTKDCKISDVEFFLRHNLGVWLFMIPGYTKQNH